MENFILYITLGDNPFDPMKRSFHHAAFPQSLVAAAIGVLGISLPAKGELTEGQLQQIKNHQALEVCSGMDQVLPLSALPEGIHWEEGKLSLIADVKDRKSGRMALYLVNATPEKFPGFPSSAIQSFKEAKIAGRWERAEVREPGCFGIIPGPGLAPGEAELLEAGDPAAGDVEGDVRFCLPLSPSIATASIHGHFSLEDVHDARRDPMSVSLGCDELSALESGQWERGRASKSMEEFLGELELIRAYDQSWTLRDRLSAWCDQHSGEAYQIRRIIVTLPWLSHQDEQSCFELCMASLKGRVGPFSRPHAMVWRFLVQGPGRSYFPNPEREIELRAIKASGNPWNADPKGIERLVELATAEVEGGKADVAEAAFNFLRQDWVPVSDGVIECFALVAEGKTPMAAADGLKGLVAAGHEETATEIAKRRGLEMPEKKALGK